MRSKNKINMRSPQKGATLIIVLVILLIITVVGVLAIRVSIVSLAVATNSQVDQLNFQSADTPLALVSQINPTDLTNLSNVIGASLREHENNPGAEYVFCYQPISTTAKFAQTKDAIRIRFDSSANSISKEAGTVDGFCNLNSDFGSKRQAVLTQVAVSVPIDASNNRPGANLPRGTNVSEGTQLPKSMTSAQRVRVTTTSMLPAYSSETTSSIQESCLSAANIKISDNLAPDLSSQQTIADCLKSKNVPFNVHVQEFNYINKLTEVTAPGG